MKWKELEQRIRKAWKRWRKGPEQPRFYRPQIRFRQRYPQYQIGLGSYGLPLVHDWDEGSTLKIGNFCSIADNVQIFLGGHHRIDWVSCYPFPAYLPEAAHITEYGGTRGDVIIGSDVWLCANCTILSGVTVGHGAVVASGAVVSRDVPPYSVVAGNPARHVRWRFDEKTRNELLDSAWWNWPEAEIRQTVEKLCSSDIQGFLAYARSRPVSE
ncbi:CatB-related O-acetyltransferase [Ectopseudomonas chengduensis]|uniref:CatB-related O-acetyltransferase n=1 Tax=Pseudomonas sp. NPDC077649 TaxID=3364423 RepID=UPI0031F5FA9C